MPIYPSRRQALKTLITGAAALQINPLQSFATTQSQHETPQRPIMKGNINHSVCQWCYGSIPLEEFCSNLNTLGITAMDLVGPKGWDTLKKYGIYSSMCNGAEISLTKGWNDTQYHEQLIKNYSEMIPMVAKAGYKNLICFSGNRNGMADDLGMRNCAEGLKKIMPLAEKNGVTIVMELLNSKIDHKDYMCDRTHWGVELCKMVGSDNFKLLYDIYHMQIDEGDVIRTIRESHAYIAHYHTGGVPGRNEIDETQELYYPAIMKAIVETGFKGYVAQEFIPTWKHPIAALAKAVNICDV